MTQQNVLKRYEQRQAEIERMLKQIQAGLEKHDQAASAKGGHHWGHVGDLDRIVTELIDIRDRLHGKGEYSQKNP